MNNKEYFEWLAQSKKDKKYFSDMTSPFNDYIDNPDGKYVVTITKSQYVFYADFGNDHALMAAELTRRIRPDLKIDGWGNAYNREEDFRLHNIFIFGYPNYSLVSIPEKEMLSIEQFKELEKILLNIKEHNDMNADITMMISLDRGVVSYRRVKEDMSVRKVAEYFNGKGHDAAATNPITSCDKENIIKVLTRK